MNKREFLKALEKRLKNLPKKEIQKSLAFYSEIIDDRMEEGASEAEAVKNLGTPDEVAREILSDASFSTIVRGSAERIRTKSGGNTLFVVLAIIGFPIWFPLLVTAAVLLFSGRSCSPRCGSPSSPYSPHSSVLAGRMTFSSCSTA